MFEVLMVILACVMGAAALVVALSTMSACAAGVRRLDSLAKHVNHELAELRTTATRSASTTLRAELDDLRGALDVIRASNRKEFGALWGRMGGRGSNNGKVFDGASGLPLEGDEELDALLALQAAKPVQPAQ